MNSKQIVVMPIFGGWADDARIMATFAKHTHQALHRKLFGGHHHTLPRANVIALRAPEETMGQSMAARSID
jgi:hypothetical protein